MPNSLDLDVDVDWLYKGKRKVRSARREKEEQHQGSSSSAKASGTANASENDKPPNNESQGSGSPAQPHTRHRSKSQSSATSPSSPLTSAGLGANLNSSSHSSTPPSSRPRHNSISGSLSLRRTSSNSSEKPKKSLFGSLFNRKPVQPPSPPEQQHQQQQQHQQHQQHSTVVTEDSHGGSAAASIPSTSGGTAGQSKGVPIPVSASQIASHRQQFSQFLKEPNSPEIKDIAPIQSERVVLNRNKNKSPLPIKELSTIKMKRVTFAVDKFGMDPPQQIPSRKPKLGNVLVPDDLISDIPSISQGITTSSQTAESSGGNSTTAPPTFTKNSREYLQALENHKKSLKESEKHQQEAHYAAQRIASEVASFKLRNVSSDPKSTLSRSNSSNALKRTTTAEDEAGTELDENIKKLEIDKPIHMHEHHFDDEPNGGESTSSGADPNSSTNELMLDVIYTRCCHLREILPIPSTLRQLKDKTAPLQTLKFLNPRPTLIDILSFSDFISIVPIHNVVFDNVGLTPEMFKIVISSLVRSKALDRLSMRNVVIDENGWKLLCKFLMRNDSIIKLDISQTKIRHDLDPRLHRSQMDWYLFIDVLQKRKGKPLEELLINGISFNNNLPTFEGLIYSFSSSTNRNSRKLKLGIAQSHISVPEQIEILFRWMSEKEIMGVDLAFNDFEHLTKPIIKELSRRNFDSLQYFTLNSTNIQSVQEAALIIRELSKLPQLYFLDLSGLPSLFPAIFPYLNKYLPRFPALKRIHFDSNEWSYKDISLISQILPKCKELLHVSMMNQPQESWVMSTAVFLYDCIKNSEKLINLDFNYENIPEEINSRIAIALVRNAQKSIDSNWQLDELSSQDDLLFDGELISETAGNILDKFNDSAKLKEDSTKRYLLKRYWEKINKIHANVQKTIDDMFEQRASKELSLQSKENLLRLLFMEKTLANILEYLSTNPYIKGLEEQKASEDDTNSFMDEKPVLKHMDSARLTYDESSVYPQDPDMIQDQDPNNSKPHLMATDSGRTIDVTTGRPILTKTSSERSLFGKKQEEEEGELHKWGFFIQQQRSIYPENTPMSKYQQQQQQQAKESKETKETKEAREKVMSQTPRRPSSHSDSISSSVTNASSSSKLPVTSKIIPKIPSGAELREAIIKAKGINSIEDLIDNVSCQRVKLDNIYGIQVEAPIDGKASATTPSSKFSQGQHLTKDSKASQSDTAYVSESEDSFAGDDDDDDGVSGNQINVDETYDKLLNNLSRVRSNRGS